jgi:hypothetical protein
VSAPGAVEQDASGRLRLALNWTGGEPGALIKVYRKGYGDYPFFKPPGAPAPALPASPTTAEGAGWTLTGVHASGEADQPPTRDYWYYVLFSVDACGNVSPVSNLAVVGLDYLLGDVSNGSTPCAGDNVVDTKDVSLLGDGYGAQISGPGDENACLDVGPTTNRLPTGRPEPDGLVAFEDLLMFAMNYTLPAGPGPLAAETRREAPAPAAANALSLIVPTLPKVGETFAVTVHIAGKGDVQGLSLELGYDRAVVEMVKAEPGELLSRQAARTVVLSPQPGQVDVALLGKGAGLSGEGELALVEFRVKAAGDPAIVLIRSDARDAQNRAVAVAGATQPPSPKLPTVTQLAPAKPNPFSQSVTLSFSLAAGGPVEISVYSVTGRKMRTLVRRVRDPGEYSVVWDGRDEDGRATATGVYYARLYTPQGRFTRTMLFLK